MELFLKFFIFSIFQRCFFYFLDLISKQISFPDPCSLICIYGIKFFI